MVQLERFRKKKTSRSAKDSERGDESDTSFAGSVSGGDDDDLENLQPKVLLMIDFTCKQTFLILCKLKCYHLILLAKSMTYQTLSVRLS